MDSLKNLVRNIIVGNLQEISLDEENQPVVNVSWEDAVAFAEWLSQKSGQTYRLPTEAEWEYAARSGSNQSRFWGNNPNEACTYANVADLTAKKHREKWTAFSCDDGYAVSAPVGSFKPSGNGLYDMLGNVWEWCEDVYNSEAYDKLPKDNPLYGGIWRVQCHARWRVEQRSSRDKKLSSSRAFTRFWPSFSRFSAG